MVGDNHKIMLDKQFIKKIDLYQSDFHVERWSEWSQLPVEDKKILAVLYWEQLSDEMKSEFYDPELIEAQRRTMKSIQERYTNPTKLRAYFLEKSGPIVDLMIKAATTPDEMVHMNPQAFKEVWEIFKGVISQANSLASPLDLKSKTVSEQIDTILTKVSDGDITFDEAKEYMSLVSQGFNLQELPKLMAQLEKLENS